MLLICGCQLTTVASLLLALKLAVSTLQYYIKVDGKMVGLVKPGKNISFQWTAYGKARYGEDDRAVIDSIASS